MDIQPIKNEKDYDRVLAEIERLWGLRKVLKLVTNWISCLSLLRIMKKNTIRFLRQVL